MAPCRLNREAPNHLNKGASIVTVTRVLSIAALVGIAVATAVAQASDPLLGTRKLTRNRKCLTRYDGKDHPASGSSPFGDTLAITRVNPNTVRIVSKLAGKQTIVQTIVVAPDGKTRTTTAKGTDAKGQPIDSMSFYEKQ
jgi:hypothetical protein